MAEPLMPPDSVTEPLTGDTFFLRDDTLVPEVLPIRGIRHEMSTNFVHVLTVIGEAASEVESACDDLLGRRVESESNSYSSDDWSDRDHCDLAELCETLVGTSHHLPVLYSARYLDGWSTGGLQYAPLEWPDGRERLILGDRYDLAFYPSRYRDTFLPRLKAMRRRKVYREQSEYRWHADHMKEAIEAALWLDAPFLVLAISQFLEPTRHDEDIKAALRASIKLPGRVHRA